MKIVLRVFYECGRLVRCGCAAVWLCGCAAGLLPQLRVLRVEDECDLLLEGRGVVLACSQLEV